ncbi:T9SS type A sorting domain-containing protein [Salibacter halophilus]|uniref:T9SS type A sorting domain-containing protein n=1 Tax=Salibacter halophilus TaxID=1803916 RepID=A0A6N6M8G0_9FLAO|nr:T9SS type A sorting domain-containing protein [Salibacter halophilus]KAB1064537.1 T9SS type A sorting domain-containing protein [Salibacter halophilus]
MKRLLLYIAIMLAFLSRSEPVTAQSDTFFKTYGTGSFDEGNDLIQTQNGDFVIVGATGVKGDESFGDIYVIRTDTGGNVIWTSVIGTGENDKAHAVTEAPNGDLLIAGVSYGFIGGYDGMVARIDSQGNLLWIRVYGGSEWDFCYDIGNAFNSNGFIVAGSRGNETTGFSDGWIFRIDDNGDIQENQVIGGPDNDGFNGMDILQGYYVFAGFSEPEPNNPDYWVHFTNFELSEIYSETWGSDSAERFNDVAITGSLTNRNVTAVGSYQSDQKLNPVSFNLDQTGVRVWSDTVFGADEDEWLGVKDGIGPDIFMYGYSYSSIGAGKEDILLMVRDDFNNISELETTGGDNLDIARGGVVVDSNLVLAGVTKSFNAEVEDVFLLNLDRNFTQLTLTDDYRDTTYNYVTGVDEQDLKYNKNHIKVYPNPLSNGQLSIDIGDQYKQSVSFRILSINGDEVLNGELSSGLNQFVVSELNPGVYMILIESDRMNTKKTTIKKLVIN